MKLLKKLIITITIIMLLLASLVPPKIVFASTPASSADVGDAIASVAEDFYRRHAINTIYDYNSGTNGARAAAYRNETTSGVATGPFGRWTKDYYFKYAIDCVGFVSMIIHRATQLGHTDSDGKDLFTLFAVPLNTRKS